MDIRDLHAELVPSLSFSRKVAVVDGWGWVLFSVLQNSCSETWMSFSKKYLLFLSCLYTWGMARLLLVNFSRKVKNVKVKSEVWYLLKFSQILANYTYSFVNITTRPSLVKKYIFIVCWISVKVMQICLKNAQNVHRYCIINYLFEKGYAKIGI